MNIFMLIVGIVLKLRVVPDPGNPLKSFDEGSNSVVTYEPPNSEAGLTALIFWFYLQRKPKNFPPGPRGLPIVGYIPFISKNPAKTFLKLKEKFGSVVSVQFGQEDWVILNDYDTISEAFVKQGQKFSGRPYNLYFDLITKGGGFLTLDYGSTWKALSQFGHATLKEMGMGKKSMETNVIEELKFLIESLTSSNGESIRVRIKLNLAVSNMVCRIVLGSRLEYHESKFKHMIEMFMKQSEATSYSHMLFAVSMAPFLRFIPPFSNVVKVTSDEAECLMAYPREFVEEHESNFDDLDIRDFIDAFLNEMKKREKDDDAFNKSELIRYVRDLFHAGSVTTSATLTWALLALVCYPICHEKIEGEVLATLGEDGVPSMKHRDKMPYTCAFIQELIRHKTMAPLGVFHKNNEEANIYGYTIPINTTIVPNIWAVHNDPKYFENPREFRPERFLDRDEKFCSSRHVIPFSIGLRHCMGEQLARMELFVFLTGIIQKLKVFPDPVKPLPSFYEGIYCMGTYEPPQFNVVFERR
ncbi:cytochrome P450 2B19-like [Styela clava]